MGILNASKFLILIVSLGTAYGSKLSFLPHAELSRSWNSKPTQYPMGYGSADLAVKDDLVYVVNGADDGNEIVKFELDGKYVGKYPGWYNWPIDLALGPNNQMLVSATGARMDDNMLRYGMVMYNSSGQFFHGFQESQTGIGRPFGMDIISTKGDVSEMVVCDWWKNKTNVVQVDWSSGNITVNNSATIHIPYPTNVVVSKDRILVSSYACCEPWQEPLRKISLFEMTSGKLVAEVKHLPTGEFIKVPKAVAVDPSGNYLVVDMMLKKTLMFSPELKYMGEMAALGTPLAIKFYKDELYLLSGLDDDEQAGEGQAGEQRVEVYSYKY